VRTLLSCMRRPPRCGLHNGPPRAALTLRCMAARRSAPKPPRTSEPHAGFAALGRRVSDSGPQISKTLMLQELETLLAAVPIDAATKAYRAAILEENVLGKGTLSVRKETACRLTTLHGLDPTKPLVRVLRWLWGVVPNEHPQLALLDGLARDPLLMATREQTTTKEIGELTGPAFRLGGNRAGLGSGQLGAMEPCRKSLLCMTNNSTHGVWS